MEVIYIDKDIIVVKKEVGVLSQSDKNGNRSMIEEIKDYLKSINEKDEIFLIHRLDRNVSGVMVFARSSFSASKLNKQITENKFEKTYFAVVHGKPDDKGEMVDLLFKDSRKGKTYVVNRERKGVKKAMLTFERVATKITNYGELSLVKVKLITGRTHQIRVQFSSRKMPLVADGKYGGMDNGINMGLFSHKIGFYHPRTDEKLTFSLIPNFEPFNFFEI